MTGCTEETIALGERLAADLHVGDVVALIGPLGAGKTHMIRGMATGLGVPDPLVVTSPTFVLLQEYRGRVQILHFDLYRAGPADLETLGFFDLRESSVTLIEWADRAPEEALGRHLRVRMEIRGENEREVSWEWRNGRPGTVEKS